MFKMAKTTRSESVVSRLFVPGRADNAKAGRNAGSKPPLSLSTPPGLDGTGREIERVPSSSRVVEEEVIAHGVCVVPRDVESSCPDLLRLLLMSR